MENTIPLGYTKSTLNVFKVWLDMIRIASLFLVSNEKIKIKKLVVFHRTDLNAMNSVYPVQRQKKTPFANTPIVV